MDFNIQPFNLVGCNSFILLSYKGNIFYVVQLEILAP